jgi:hypothetical protein
MVSKNGEKPVSKSGENPFYCITINTTNTKTFTKPYRGIENVHSQAATEPRQQERLNQDI